MRIEVWKDCAGHWELIGYHHKIGDGKQHRRTLREQERFAREHMQAGADVYVVVRP